ncbi:MAG: hypothetical protein JSU70_15470 [Phycisphaerales bacterium]|nr:MAG: hypothetical protein JSU70_15470 [Phycisphaerales bacterium]
MVKSRVVHLGDPNVVGEVHRTVWQSLHALARRPHIQQRTVFASAEASKSPLGISTGLCFESTPPYLYLDAVPDCGCGFYLARLKDADSLDWKKVIHDFTVTAGLYAPSRDILASSLTYETAFSDSCSMTGTDPLAYKDIFYMKPLQEAIRATYALFIGHFLEIRRVIEVNKMLSHDTCIGDFVIILHSGAPIMYYILQQLCGVFPSWDSSPKGPSYAHDELAKRFTACIMASNFARKSRLAAAGFLLDVLINHHRVPPDNVQPLSDVCHSCVQVTSGGFLHRRGVQDLQDSDNRFFCEPHVILLTGSQETSSYLLSPSGIIEDAQARFVGHGTPQEFTADTRLIRVPFKSQPPVFWDTKPASCMKNLCEAATYQLVKYYAETVGNLQLVARLIPFINIQRADIAY